ncbi:hypothetical protein GCM10027051_32700 [Niabella terrae]
MSRRILVVSTEKRFDINSEGRIVNIDNTRASKFWSRYLDVFDEVVVAGRVNTAAIVESKNYVESDRISVFKLPYYHGLLEGVFCYLKLLRSLKQLIGDFSSSSFLLRLPGAIGNMLAKVLQSAEVSYSVELVGDPFEVFNTQQTYISKFLAVKTRWELRKVVKNAHSIAYVTERYLQRQYPFENGFTINYSSIELSSKFLRNEQKIFCSPVLSLIGVGSLEFPYKGVSFLLEALSVLNKDQIDFSLTWIGGGKLLEKYIQDTRELGITDKINFLGTVPNEEICTFFELNNIFVMPSLTEGLPRAMIEAMASRLICVGSNVGGIPELLNENCLFESGDVNAIVEKLYEIIDKFEEFKKYSDINYMKSKNFLPELLRERRNTFYSSIINS